MDRYLFRGKRVNNGEWVSGYLSVDTQGIYQIDRVNVFGGYFDAVNIFPTTVSQSTGLYAAKSYHGDCKGERMMFEGDIVECQDFNHLTRKKIMRCIVIWDRCKWVLATLNQVEAYEDLWGIMWGVNMAGCEIVGTIHDHPELLGGNGS